jgi:putative transcriptional regulator
MIQFNFKQLLADKAFEEKRRIHLKEIAKKTGISRTTLSKIANSKGEYKTSSENIEKLCQYFECTPDQFMTIIPDPEPTEKESLAT